MIPATAIHFNDDDTAWYVVPAAGDRLALDRPCDRCDGTEVTETEHGIIDPSDGSVTGVGTVIHACPDCVNGRHTLTVEVEVGNMRWDRIPSPPRTLRISVVPGMVLPIVRMGDYNPDAPDRLIAMNGRGNAAYHVMGKRPIPVTLPPDAKPCMWAVKLQVHQ